MRHKIQKPIFAVLPVTITGLAFWFVFGVCQLVNAQTHEPIAHAPANPALPSMEAFPHMPHLNWNPGAKYADSVRPFQGVPSVAVTPGGRLWVTWYGGGINEGPENYVMLATSDDKGESWSDLKLVIDPPYRCSESQIWIEPAGKMWLMWSMLPIDLQRPGTQVWAMTTDNPDDEAPVWGTPRLIANELHILNKPTVLSNGTWVIPTLSGQWANLRHFMPPPSAPIGHLSRPLLSYDNGQTFVAGGEIPVPDSMRNFDEYQVVERKDGSLWILNRTIPAPYGIGESFSYDGGKTWAPMVHSKIRNTTTRIFFSRLASGGILLVKNGPIDQDVGRSQMMAFVSRDEGATWEGGLILDERNSVSYPDGAQAANGTIYIAYDRERTVAKEILLARFTEEDVMAGRLVSDGSHLKILVNKATGTPDPDSPLSEGLAYAVARHRAAANQAQQMQSVAFNTGDKAVVDPGRNTVQELVAGIEIFSDRDFALAEVPERLHGKQFVRMSIQGDVLHVLRAGMVYIASPAPERSDKASLQSSLARQGFQRTDAKEFAAFRHPIGEAFQDETLCTIFQKKVEVGEVIAIGTWGLLIF